MPLVTMLGLVGNILSILVLRSPRIDMKVRMVMLLRSLWWKMMKMMLEEEEEEEVMVVMKVTWEETLTW